MLVVDLDNLTVQDVTKIIDEKNVRLNAAELSLWVKASQWKLPLRLSCCSTWTRTSKKKVLLLYGSGRNQNWRAIGFWRYHVHNSQAAQFLDKNAGLLQRKIEKYRPLSPIVLPHTTKTFWSCKHESSLRKEDRCMIQNFKWPAAFPIIHIGDFNHP